MKLDLITVGHIVKETIQFPDRTIGPVLGSPAAYVSVIAGKLGTKTGIVTKIGKDMPESLLKPFFDANVDRQGIRIEGENSTTNLLIYDKKGNKTFRYLKRASDILIDDIPSDYLKAKMAYICPMDGEVPIQVVKNLADGGVKLAVDLDGYGGRAGKLGRYLTRQGIKMRDSFKELAKIIKYFSIVKVGAADSLHLFRLKKRDEEEIARMLVKLGAEVGIITLGKKGSIVADKESVFKIPSIPAKVVDTTGGGDAYIAGFLTEYLRTNDIWRSALFGSGTASIVIESSDGVNYSRMPKRSDVYERVLTFLKS